MSPSNDSNSIWFGVSMFLLGVIAGFVISIASTSSGFGAKAPAAPTATPPPAAQQAPQAAAKDRMVAVAKDIGLDTSAFGTCIASDKFNKLIMDQLNEGSKAGVTGTPGNFIYSRKTKNAVALSGARPIDAFSTVIDAMLKDPNYKSTDPQTPNVTTLAAVDLTNDRVTGDTSADIVIVEYSDYQCPYCVRVHPTHKQLLQKYDGKVMWVFRHFPLTSIHPDAMPLAVGSECAREQGGNEAFWKYTDKIMGA